MDTITTPEITTMLPATTGIDAEVDIELLRVVPKKFEVCDEKTANWLVRRIQNARQLEAHVKEWAEMERRRAQREEAVLMYLFGRQLERWSREQVEKLGGRRKSIALPAGTVAFRSVPPSLQIDDEMKVLAWARKNCPQAVVIVEKLSRSILSDHFRQTGEVPDIGAHIEGQRESFSIR